MEFACFRACFLNYFYLIICHVVSAFTENFHIQWRPENVHLHAKTNFQERVGMNICGWALSSVSKQLRTLVI